MSDNPTSSSSAKATADRGEWTAEARKAAEQISEILGHKRITTTRLQSIIQGAINAALAAAWRKGHADAQAPALERIDELHQQLAAERESRIKLTELAVKFEKQLAAEREKLTEEIDLHCKTMQELQTLRDALMRCVSRITPCHEEGAVYKQAIDALAKVGDGKK